MAYAMDKYGALARKHGLEPEDAAGAPANEEPPIWPRTSPPAGAQWNLTTSSRLLEPAGPRIEANP